MSLQNGTPQRDRQSVKIAGERYFLAKIDEAQAASGRTWVTDLKPSQRADPTDEFELPLVDWSQGAGFTYAGLDGAYDRANGWDASTPGKPATWPQRATGEAITTADYKGWQFQLGNYLYVARGRFVAKYAIDDTGGAEWAVIEVHDLGSGIVVAGRPAIFQGAAYVPRRSGAGGTTELFHELTTVATHVTEVQTIVMSGTPTSGTYTITFDGKTTAALAYNADGAAVQAALRLIAGMERVTVVTTGSTPNYTHTVTMTGVGGALAGTSPPQMTSTDSTSGGSHAITHNTTVAGTTDTWTAGDSDIKARCFRVWQNKLVLANLNYIRTTSDDPLIDTNWFPAYSGVGYQVGDSGREITDLATYGPLLIVGKTDGVWSFNESLATVNEIPSIQGVVDDSNCIGMDSLNGPILIPHKTGLISWEPGTFRYVGAEQEGALEGDLSRGWGRVAGIASYGKYGFFVTNDALDTSGAVMSLQPPLGTRARSPLVPHMHHEHDGAALEHALIVQSTAQPVSPHGPATWSDDNAVGANSWTSPGNAAAEDGTLATVSSTGISHYLKGLNPAPGVPSTATIQGIAVDVKRKVIASTPTYRDSQTTLGNSNTNLTVLKPTGTVDGDVIIAALAYDHVSGDTVTAPAGWTLVIGGAIGSGKGGYDIYTKVASSEPASWSWTLNNARAFSLIAATFTNVDTTSSVFSRINAGVLFADASHRWNGAGGSTLYDTSVVVAIGTTFYDNPPGTGNMTGDPSGYTSRVTALGSNAGGTRLFGTRVSSLAYSSITDTGTHTWQGGTTADLLGFVTIILPGKHAAADTTLKLVKGGSVVGSNYAATGTQWPTALATASYGGALDLWGTTWTAAQVNASDFGVVLSATLTSGASLAVDSITITVYYTVPGVADTPSFLSVLKVDDDRVTVNPVIYTLPRAGLTIANDPNIDRAIDDATLYSSRFYQPSRNVQKTYRNVEFWLEAEPETNTPGVQIWASVDDGTPFQLEDAEQAVATFRTTGFHQAYFPLSAASVGHYVQIHAVIPATAGAEVPVAVSFRDMIVHGTADPLMTEEISNVVLVLGEGEFDDRGSMRRTVAQQIADLSALAAPTTAPVPYTDPVTGDDGYLKLTACRFREVVFKGATVSTIVALVSLRKTA